MKFPTAIKVKNRSYEVLYKSAKGLSSTVRIKNGKVLMSLSRFSRGKSRNKLVEKFVNWVVKRLSKVSSDFVLPEYVDGGRICTHNKVYELELKFENRKSVRTVLVGSIIKLFLPIGRDDVKELVEKAIIKDQTGYLQEVVGELNQLHFSEFYNLLRFKRTSSRFGSCSSKRNINIAYRLLFAPREVFRYVCVHELAHLREMNHSKRFWILVEEAMPEYKEHEKWLRESGFVLG